MMTNLFKNLLLVCTLTLIFACNSGRDNINFKVDVNIIIDSLEYISETFDSCDGFEGYFYNGENYFYLNNKKLFKVDSNSLINNSIFKEKVFAELNPVEKEIFNKSIFLNNNMISSAWIDTSYNLYMFEYKPSIDNSFDNFRVLLLLKNGNDKELSEIEKRFIILDRKDNLLLLKLRKLSEYPIKLDSISK